MKDQSFYDELERALRKSHSKRKGDWSTPRQVGDFTDERVTLPAMRELVRKHMAVEKKNHAGVFKPKSGAGGGGESGLPFSPGYRSPEGWSDPYRSPNPYDNPRGEDTTNPPTGGILMQPTSAPRRGSSPRKPSGRRNNLSNTLGRGIGALIMGAPVGGASSAGAGSVTYRPGM